MRYLADAGMSNEDINALVGLVTEWLGEADLDRLDELSRGAAEEKVGPGQVLGRWINGHCKLLLALLLDSSTIADRDLAAAYAVSHAANVVLASYLTDSVPEEEDLFLNHEDDLD